MKLKLIAIFLLLVNPKRFRIKAEYYFTNFLIKYIVLVSAADHAGNLFKKIFSYSPIAKKIMVVGKLSLLPLLM